MKKTAAFIGALSLMLASTPSLAGKEAGNGGDFLRAAFIRTGRNLVVKLSMRKDIQKYADQNKIDFRTMMLHLNTDFIKTTSDPLEDLNGESVDSIGSPAGILLQRDRWDRYVSQSSPDLLERMVLHELLRSVSIDDHSYWMTDVLFAMLSTPEIKDRGDLPPASGENWGEATDPRGGLCPPGMRAFYLRTVESPKCGFCGSDYLVDFNGYLGSGVQVHTQLRGKAAKVCLTPGRHTATVFQTSIFQEPRVDVLLQAAFSGHRYRTWINSHGRDFSTSLFSIRVNEDFSWDWALDGETHR